MVSPADAVLAVRRLCVGRPGGIRVELPELTLAAGGAAALVGSSGCGKTTALMGLLRLQPELEVEGWVEVCGAELPVAGSSDWRRLLRERLAVVLQDARASLDPLTRLGVQLEQATGASRDQAVEALAALGIEDAQAVLRRFPHQVSGGQAQRVCLAVALLRAPALVVADEPTAALDDERLEDLLRCFEVLRQRTGTAVLVATHDHALIEGLAAEAYRHDSGRFVRAGASVAAWPRAEGTAGADPALSCRGIGVLRGGQWILRDFSLDLPRGSIVALVGPSGAGKSTLAKVLSGHLQPDEGEVQQVRAGAVQMLFQDAYASLTPGRTVGALVREVATADFDVAAQARELGLDEKHLGRTAASLSGGERRRAALLRALAVRPEVLVLDEPTASLDRDTAIPVVELLLRTQRRDDVTYLLITHDLDLARAVADSVVKIEDGRRIA